MHPVAALLFALSLSVPNHAPLESTQSVKLCDQSVRGGYQAALQPPILDRFDRFQALVGPKSESFGILWSDSAPAHPMLVDLQTLVVYSPDPLEAEKRAKEVAERVDADRRLPLEPGLWLIEKAPIPSAVESTDFRTRYPLLAELLETEPPGAERRAYVEPLALLPAVQARSEASASADGSSKVSGSATGKCKPVFVSGLDTPYFDAIGGLIQESSCGATVAVLDSGVVAHECFGGRLLPGSADCTSTPGQCLPSKSCPGAGCTHGTAVAGLVAAEGWGFSQTANILSVRIFDSTQCTDHVRLRAAIRYARGAGATIGVAALHNLQSLSLASIQSELDKKEILWMFGAGNTSFFEIDDGWKTDQVVLVGGVDENLCWSSCCTQGIDLAAPAWTLPALGSPGGFNGTSAASGVVAGVAAAIASAESTSPGGACVLPSTQKLRSLLLREKYESMYFDDYCRCGFLLTSSSASPVMSPPSRSSCNSRRCN